MPDGKLNYRAAQCKTSGRSCASIAIFGRVCSQVKPVSTNLTELRLKLDGLCPTWSQSSVVLSGLQALQAVAEAGGAFSSDSRYVTGHPFQSRTMAFQNVGHLLAGLVQITHRGQLDWRQRNRLPGAVTIDRKLKL